MVSPQQGHGWGYRYLHGLLGNLALFLSGCQGLGNDVGGGTLEAAFAGAAEVVGCFKQLEQQDRKSVV